MSDDRTIEHAMSVRATAASHNRDRVEWVDRAKAISILLVVLWHIFNSSLWLNQAFLFVRMPLFFMVAGFFSSRAIDSEWKVYLRDKVGHFLYLYVLWTGIYFVTKAVPEALVHRDAIPVDSLLKMFWEPTLTLWFIYALAIVFLLAKIFHTVKPAILLSGLFILFCVSMRNGNLVIIEFIDKIARLGLFFVIGSLSFPFLKQFVSAYSRYWLPVMGLFLGLAAVVLYWQTQWIGPIALIVSVVGIAGVLLFSQAIDQTWIGAVLKYIGSRTIHVYVLHRIILLYLQAALAHTPLNLTAAHLIAFVGGVSGALVIGYWADRLMPWLFAAPWTAKGSKRAKGISDIKISMQRARHDGWEANDRVSASSSGAEAGR